MRLERREGVDWRDRPGVVSMWLVSRTTYVG